MSTPSCARLVACALLVPATHLAPQRRSPPNTSLTIDNVTVIDGTGAAPRTGMRIVVRKGVIAAVEPATGAPDTGRVIDAHGLFAIPGLIDGHVHLSGATWQDRTELLRHALTGGVTSVYELAGDNRISGDLARAVLTHEIEGPTIYYSALMAGAPFFTDPRAIGISHGFAIGTAPWAQAVGPDTDMPRAIAEARGAGAGTLKLYASLDSVTVTRATAEAHRQGMHVVAHATTFPAKPSDLVTAGVDMLAHAAYLVWEGSPRTPDWTQRSTGDFVGVPADSPVIERLLRSMAEHGVALNPTLWVFAESQPPDSVVSAGLTPMQALVSATSNAARVIGDTTRGAIAVGRAADIVLLNANPLDAIANTRRIQLVIKDGIVVGDEAAPAPTGASKPITRGSAVSRPPASDGSHRDRTRM